MGGHGRTTGRNSPPWFGAAVGVGHAGGSVVGRPQTRARRAANERGDVGEPLGAPRAHDAGTHAGTHARTHARAAPAPGPHTRAALDDAQAGQVAQLADVLAAGMVVRVERLRPTWCAGWLDEVELLASAYGELLEFIRDEWGGERFKLTALHPDGRPLLTSTVPIAGPPRLAGQFISRRKWDARMHGTDDDAEPTKRDSSDATPPPVDAATNLIALFLTEQRNSRNDTLEAVKAMTTDNKTSVATLVAALGEQAQHAREGGTLKAQLGQLAEGIEAVEEIKQSVVDTLPEPADAGADGDTSPLVAMAQEHFLKSFLGTQGTPSPTPEGSRAPSPNPGSNGAAGAPQTIPFAKH